MPCLCPALNTQTVKKTKRKNPLILIRLDKTCVCFLLLECVRYTQAQFNERKHESPWSGHPHQKHVFCVQQGVSTWIWTSRLPHRVSHPHDLMCSKEGVKYNEIIQDMDLNFDIHNRWLWWLLPSSKQTLTSYPGREDGGCRIGRVAGEGEGGGAGNKPQKTK